MDVTTVSQSYSATNWQQEVCHFQNAFDKSGGVSFTYSSKNQYVYGSHQAGQLSNLQSLAPTNRKSDIYSKTTIRVSTNQCELAVNLKG